MSIGDKSSTKGHALAAWAEPSLFRSVRLIAKQRGWSISQVVRMAITDYVKRYREENRAA